MVCILSHLLHFYVNISPLNLHRSHLPLLDSIKSKDEFINNYLAKERPILLGWKALFNTKKTFNSYI